MDDDRRQVELGGTLDLSDVVDVARHGRRISIAADARAAVERSRTIVEAWADAEEPAYGISTGFGGLATTRIPRDRREQLQRSLIRSHAAGMGPPVEREVVRAMMLLRARTLAFGCSGVRPEVIDAIVALLNEGVTPIVPEHGSLGCSGDLAPLAHAALALMGEGLVDDGTDVVPAAEALARIAIEPLVLREKEGLALINGTDGMLGMLVLAIADLRELFVVADIAAAMSVEGLLGTDRAYADDLQALRPHPGQRASAANLRAMLAGSGIVSSHRLDDPRVQDAYSVRCAPQVVGAARDTADFAAEVARRELASAIDNPVILGDGRIESNGNFHGAPLGFACDFLAIAAAEVGSISERRTDRALDHARSHGLPPFVADDPGVDSGLMIAQYTAAAMVAENRRLAAPASVDNVPTSAMQEDHVSMGWGAARKLRLIIDNLRRVLAVEIVTAARSIAARAPHAPAPATAAVCDALRAAVPDRGPDRFLAADLAAATDLVGDGTLRAAAERVTGALA